MATAQGWDGKGLVPAANRLIHNLEFWELFSSPKLSYNNNMGEKKCDYCGISFPEDNFGVALTTSTKIYRRRKCRDCYRMTKQALIQQYFQWINEYKKDRGCNRCGIADPRVLDFHHKKGEDKLFTVGGFRRSVGFDRIKAEVEKCEIVCANCHRILHDEIRTSRKKPGP